MLSLSPGLLPKFAEALASRHNCYILNFTGAVMVRDGALMIMDAIARNPTPVAEVILTDSSISAWDDIQTSIEVRCIMNQQLIEDRHLMRFNERQAKAAAEAEAIVFKESNRMIHDFKVIIEAFKKQEFKERRQLQLAWRFARSHARGIESDREMHRGLVEVSTTVSQEETTARQALELKNEIYFLILVDQASDDLIERIVTSEATSRKRLWRQYCADWNVSNSELKRRLRGYKHELLELQKQHILERREITQERWKEFDAICEGWSELKAKCNRIQYEQRLRQEEESRKHRQKVLEESASAERARERARLEQAKREAGIARDVNLADREFTKIRLSLEEAEATAFSSLRSIHKLHEKMAMKHRRFGELHRHFSNALKELPRIRMRVASLVEPSVIYRGRFRPAPVEPNVNFDLSMDVLWPIRALVQQQELIRLLPLTRLAKREVAPADGL